MHRKGPGQRTEKGSTSIVSDLPGKVSELENGDLVDLPIEYGDFP